jgi:hypothetical protein
MTALTPARPAAPANAGTAPTAPATAAAKLISSVERDIIVNNFHRLGYSPEEVPERIKILETKMKKSLAEFTQGEARDTIKKMEANILDLQKKEQAPPPPADLPEKEDLPEAAE